MKAISAALALALAACAAPPPAQQPASAPSPRAIPLVNAGFEAAPAAGSRCAPGWACGMHSDSNSFRYVWEAANPAEGARSMCIERVKNEPWALLVQHLEGMPLRGKTLRLSAAVRVEGIQGDGGGLFAIVQGPMRLAHHGNKLIKSGAGWQRLTLDIPVAPDAVYVEVGGTLEGGGKACFDEVRLEVVSEGKPGL